MDTLLKQKTLKIEPLLRTNDFIRDVNKDGAGLFEGAVQKFFLPNNQDGSWVAILNEAEQAEMERKLNLKPNALSFNVVTKEERKGSYWRKFSLDITSKGITLDLNKPLDLIKYRIALTQTRQIAPSWAERNDRGEYKFVILEEDVTNKETLNRTAVIETAWVEYSKIKQSNAKMVNILALMDKRVAPDKQQNTEHLQASLTTIITATPELFVNLIQDKNMDLKIFIDDCVQANLLKKAGRYTYKFPEGDGKYTIDELIKYLKDPENEFIFKKLEQQLANSK